MSLLRLFQPLGCTIGLHRLPPERLPPGPVVATCPCCRKVVYYFGLTYKETDMYPHLLLASFPRVLGPIKAGNVVAGNVVATIAPAQ